MQAAILGLVEGRRLRRLGFQETMWHNVFTRKAGTGLLVYSLVLGSDRRLEPPMVHDALEALQRQFPLLRTRVEQIDGDSHLVVGPCPDVPLTVLPPSDEWLAEHHRQVREQTIDTAAGPLWKATLMHRSSSPAVPTAAPSHRAVLHLSICHTITDGTSNGRLLGQLLENLERLADGREPDVSNPAPIPPSLKELIQNERLKLSPGLVRNALQLLGFFLRRRQHPFLEQFVASFNPALPADSYWNQLLPEVLSRQESERLRVMCRQRRVTMNAALSAAVSLAGARLLAGSGSASAASSKPPQPVSLPTMWLVDARRYLPQARGVQLSAISGTFADVRVDSTDGKDFWLLAGRIRDRLDDQLGHMLPLALMKVGVRFQRYNRIAYDQKPEKISAAMEKPQEPSSPNMFLYNINNLGSLDSVFPKTKHVRAVELHRTFRAHPALDNSFGSHCFQSVGNRLCYDLNFLRGKVREEDARRFSQEVMRVLRAVAASGDDDGGKP